MKNTYMTAKSIVFILIAFVICGCSKINDINVSPNNPPLDKATPQVLFPSAVVSTAGRVGGELDIIGGLWSQYWTQSVAASQFRTIDAYSITRNDFNGNYTELFSGALPDYQLAITQAKANKQYPFYLMCTVMKAYTYEVLVDLYDKVPYSQAFQGAANLQPKFDDGHTIYKGLLAEIDSALATNYNVQLTDADAKTDFIFKGNMDNWRKFANTLKLKMYLRMVNAYPQEAQTGVQSLYTSGADFLDVNAGVNIFSDATNLRNPLYAYEVFNLGAVNLRASKTFTSWLVANSDPRTAVYFGTAAPTPIDQGNYTASQSAQPSYYVATSPNLSATDPVYFLTAAESDFLQAEASLRYGVGDAKASFDAGVRAAFAQYNLAAPTDGVYQYPASADLQTNLRAIIYQKWASFPNSHTLEGFFDQERTGYPEHSNVYSLDPNYVPGQWVYSKNGITSGKYPKRLVYPEAERSTNSNTPPEVPITTPVWWGLPNN